MLSASDVEKLKFYFNAHPKKDTRTVLEYRCDPIYRYHKFSILENSNDPSVYKTLTFAYDIRWPDACRSFSSFMEEFFDLQETEIATRMHQTLTLSCRRDRYCTRKDASNAKISSASTQTDDLMPARKTEDASTQTDVEVNKTEEMSTQTDDSVEEIKKTEDNDWIITE